MTSQTDAGPSVPPTPTWLENDQVKEWVESFVRSNRNPVSHQITDILLEEHVHRHGDGRNVRQSLQAHLNNEIAGDVVIEVGEVEVLGGDRFAVTVVLAGMVTLSEDLPVSTVDMTVPLHFIVDLEADNSEWYFRKIEDWTIDAEAITTTVKYSPLPTEYAQ